MNFRSDTEIIGYALDTLYYVMSNEPTDEGIQMHFFHFVYIAFQ